MNEWENFKKGKWQKEINVSDFIQKNYKQYNDDESFLEEKTEKTNKIWKKCEKLLKEELTKHVLDIDTNHMSGINAFKPGYICKEDDVITLFQQNCIDIAVALYHCYVVLIEGFIDDLLYYARHMFNIR